MELSRRNLFQGLLGLIGFTKINKFDAVAPPPPKPAAGWGYTYSTASNHPITFSWTVHDHTAANSPPVSWTTDTMG